MSILRYFKKKDIVPADNDPGLLQELGPTTLQRTNACVSAVLGSNTPSPIRKQRTKYTVFSPSDRAGIGKYCSENGPNLNESTARYMRDKYRETMTSKKRKLDFSEVTEINSKNAVVLSYLETS